MNLTDFQMKTISLEKVLELGDTNKRLVEYEIKLL